MSGLPVNKLQKLNALPFEGILEVCYQRLLGSLNALFRIRLVNT